MKAGPEWSYKRQSSESIINHFSLAVVKSHADVPSLLLSPRSAEDYSVRAAFREGAERHSFSPALSNHHSPPAPKKQCSPRCQQTQGGYQLLRSQIHPSRSTLPAYGTRQSQSSLPLAGGTWAAAGSSHTAGSEVSHSAEERARKQSRDRITN